MLIEEIKVKEIVESVNPYENILEFRYKDEDSVKEIIKTTFKRVDT
jgi:hypothetical protein